MEILTVQISPADMKVMLTTFINDYIRIERTETGLDYQQKSYYKMGHIGILAALMDEKWDYPKTGQCYFDFLKYLVEKYELTGVHGINDLWEPRIKPPGKSKFLCSIFK